MRIERTINMGVSLHNTTNKSNISYKHNNREITSGNKDIDLNRIDDNIYYMQGAKNLEKWVNNEFAEAVGKYNAKQKRSDRKIGNMYEKLLKDKKVTLEREMIVQVGDKSNFWNKDGSRNEKYWELAKEVMDQYANSFQERNPNFRVYNMTLHLDEASPHLHINYLPVYHTERGLEKKVSWEKAAGEQGIEPTIGPKERKNKISGEIEKYEGVIESAFQKWRDKETGFIERLLRDREVGRHKAGSHKHMSVPEYKEMVNVLEEIKQEVDELDNDFIDLEKEISGLEEKRSELTSESVEKQNEVNVLSEELNSVKSEYEKIKGNLDEVSKEYSEKQKDIEGIIKKVDIFKREAVNLISVTEKKNILGRSTGIIEVSEKDWKYVLNKAQQTEVFSWDIRELERKNERLERENEKLQVDLKESKNSNETLKKENYLLKKTVKQIKVLCKQKIPELSTLIGYVKAEILDKAKERLLEKYFTDDERPGAQNFIRDKKEKERLRENEKMNMKSKKKQDYARKRSWDLER